jgi:hypothetical protein
MRSITFRSNPGAVTLLILAALTATAACSPVYENRYSFESGWRIATVTDVGIGSSIEKPSTKDCRRELPPRDAATRRFVRVTYPYARNQRSLIAPVAEDSALGPGDRAYADANDCGRDVVAIDK